MPISAVISAQALAGSAFESPDTDRFIGCRGSRMLTRLVQHGRRRRPPGMAEPRRSVRQAHLVDHQGVQARRKRCRGRVPDDLDAADRAHRPDRACRPGWFLARGNGAERVPAVPGGPQAAGARSTRTTAFDGPARHEPEVDEALLAAERARGCARPWRICPGGGSDSGDADGRPARFLRGDLGRAGAAGGQHRSDPRAAAWPGCACCSKPAKPQPSASASTHSATVRLDFRVGWREPPPSGRRRKRHLIRAPAVSSAGLITGIVVPGMRSPRLAGEASATAGSRSRSTPAVRSSATAREAAP